MQPYDANAGDHVIQAGNANNTPGEFISVRTDLNRRVAAWRPNPMPPNINHRYFCHGYSLDTEAMHGYTVTSGVAMATVLADEYEKIGGLNAPGIAMNDVIVFWGPHTSGLECLHSAKMLGPIYQPGGLGASLNTALTTVNSKTGTGALKIGVSLDTVKADYPKCNLIEIYRRWP